MSKKHKKSYGKDRGYKKSSLGSVDVNKRKRKNVRKKREPWTLRKVCFSVFHALAPFLCFYALEYYTHDPWQMELSPQLINYAIFLGVFLFLYYMTGHSLPGLLFIDLYSLIAGAANYFVMAFRGNPILPWDFYSINTALSVSDNYSFTINQRFIISTAVLAVVPVLGILCRGKCGRSFKGFPGRWLPGLGALIAVVMISIGMMTPAVTDEVLTFTNLFTQWASYRDNGFTVSFIENLQYMQVEKPEGYKKDEVLNELQAFLEKNEVSVTEASDSSADSVDTASDGSTSDNAGAASADAVSTADSSTAGSLISTDSVKNPTIFVVMDEAFSDLSVLHDFETNEDYMPFIHGLQSENADNVITGNLFVSVCGGNTANTEFEFLTGNSLAFLPSGSVAYQQYIHKDMTSIASILASGESSDGEEYTTAAMHPYGASGWNRNKVYPWLGFENSYFQQDFIPYSILRKYVDDASAFEKLESVYDDNRAVSDDPLFEFEVTMQNHGGYTEVFDDCPLEIMVQNSLSSTISGTENYLTLVSKTDAALSDLVSWIDAQDEPMMVVFFGDHEPNDYVAENIASLTGVAKEDRDLEESQNRYIVPYVIYANYALDKSSVGLEDADDAETRVTENSDGTVTNHVDSVFKETTTSANFLGTMIMRLAGQDMTDYQKFLSIMQETLPVITANVVIDKDGNYMTIEEAEEKYPELMGLYEKLQYYYMFDC